jgi:hypothetical protein
MEEEQTVLPYASTPYASQPYASLQPPALLTRHANSLAICELFHPVLHGVDENSSPDINNHFLIYTAIEVDDFYNKEYVYEEIHLRRYRNAALRLLNMHTQMHTQNNKHMRLEIVQAHELQPGQESVAILKTFWLRIVQRCWKKVFRARKELIKQRGSIRALRERARLGCWAPHLRQWPVFRLNLAN